jgi:NAD(P)-dependent dehydrogenase (short-subunit alcohol dehydrogenase family)
MRVALITGGTSGIGEALVRRFRSYGVFVVFTGRREALGDKIADETGAAYINADATNLADVKFTVEKAAQYGHIDLLVNNAGASIPYSGILRTNPIEFIIPFNLHVGSAVAHISCALPYMKGGCVINIASVAGYRAYCDGRSTYGVSKAALIALTQQMAPELKEHGVRMNCISPGKLGKSNLDTVVDAVVFLGSDAARFITGVDLTVDDGLVCGPGYTGER